MRRQCLAVKACERRTSTSPPGSFSSLAWHNRLPGGHSYPRYSRAILRSDRRGDDRELLLDQYAKQEEGRHGHSQREPRPRPAPPPMAGRTVQISRVVHDCLFKPVRYRLGFLLPRTGSR